MNTALPLACDNRARVSPPIGALSSRRSREIFSQTINDLQNIYGIDADHIAADAHPDYPNTRWATEQRLPVTRVFHHHAHASALVGECGITHPMLVFTWDGLGYGQDGTIWGGEALLGVPGSWQRIISFKPFRLPGGDKVTLEPWRTALSMVWESGTDWSDAPCYPALLRNAWEHRVNSPLTSAVGRLFDAAAVYTGILTESSYDGEAPIRLEAICEEGNPHPVELPLVTDEDELYRVDWSPLVDYLVTSHDPPRRKAARFHESLAWSLCEQAKLVFGQHTIHDIGLAGGVFQNRRLTERSAVLLNNAGLTVHIPAQLPVNDAAISFGQVIEAGARANASE
ncbi:MAG: carbamoyltransferase HypF [Pseudomonadales bacterium]|nr:carbamoyltransferase HypF [Pseudomonadales bacterium]